jgi:hypothetical protein
LDQADEDHESAAEHYDVGGFPDEESKIDPVAQSTNSVLI